MQDKRLTLRLGEQDAKRLKLLENHYALSASSVIRMLLKRAEDDVTAEFGRAIRKGTRHANNSG